MELDGSGQGGREFVLDEIGQKGDLLPQASRPTDLGRLEELVDLVPELGILRIELAVQPLVFRVGRRIFFLEDAAKPCGAGGVGGGRGGGHRGGRMVQQGTSSRRARLAREAGLWGTVGVAGDLVVAAPIANESIAKTHAVFGPVHAQQALVEILAITALLESAVGVALDGPGGWAPVRVLAASIHMCSLPILGSGRIHTRTLRTRSDNHVGMKRHAFEGAVGLKQENRFVSAAH